MLVEKFSLQILSLEFQLISLQIQTSGSKFINSVIISAAMVRDPHIFQVLETQIASKFKSNPLAVWNRSDFESLRFQLRSLPDISQIWARLWLWFRWRSTILNRYDFTISNRCDCDFAIWASKLRVLERCGRDGQCGCGILSHIAFLILLLLTV